MTWVFINYRRDDARLQSKLMCDALTSQFGDKRVFFDQERLVGGDDWQRMIASALKKSEYVLVVMGPNWLRVAKERSAEHKADPNNPKKRDWVVWEIEQAITLGKKIIPVLVEKASMPDKEALLALSPAFEEFPNKQFIELGLDHFQLDIKSKLIERSRSKKVGWRARLFPRREATSTQTQPRVQARNSGSSLGCWLVVAFLGAAFICSLPSLVTTFQSLVSPTPAATSVVEQENLMALPQTDGEPKGSSAGDAVTSTIAPTVSPQPTVTLVPQTDAGIAVGMFVMIEPTDNMSARIRWSPNGEIRTSVNPRTRAQVIGGPVEAAELMWWQVRTGTGLEGWVAEVAWDGVTMLHPISSPTPRVPTPAPIRLTVGERAVTREGLNIRRLANAQAGLVGSYPAGTVITLLEGPVVVDELEWWRVEADDSDLTGWIAVVQNREIMVSLLP